MKAAYYDPHRDGQGQSGWWKYPTSSDQRPVYGLPEYLGGDGSAQANAGSRDDRSLQVLLGSYAMSNPWGLFDMAGGTHEWTETSVPVDEERRYVRFFKGSGWLSTTGEDYIDGWGGDSPGSNFYGMGLRVASVPAPHTALSLVLWGLLTRARTRRRMPCGYPSSRP
ncbi:MAG: SUMF1/EgtB/PvdO family nonheme iron enzyme [Phycisphaeraceae bacterium]|nr:MAG: SUMF1/EgtB/PvdO family nonheme iron enzyme [Phycisphaeraceae bacterium]